MIQDIAIWWLVIQVLGLVALPLTQFLFRVLPDRGYAFSKALGLLLTGYLAWLIAMLGLAGFGVPLIVVCILLITVAGLVVQHSRRGAADSPAALAWLRANWRMVLAYELLFALALIFLALLRSYDPDPWGTERPMDFAFFNAIRRSTAFPPHDPWLAGYAINYYYFGYLFMAIMALLSGREPAVAYNLSLALVFALAALGAAGLVTNMIALTERAATQVSSWWHSLQTAAIALLAVLLVLFAANQGGALQIITGTNMAVALEGPDLARAIANGLGSRAPLTLSQRFKGDYFDDTVAITPTDTLQDFNWWNPTRAIWDDYSARGDPSRHYAITEFPFFSFWLGDMHPHVMALPFGLLAFALALQTIARAQAPPFALGRGGWLELVLTGVVLGSLYVINSWDFPTYVLLFLGALLLLFVRLGHAEDEDEEEFQGEQSPPHFSLETVWWKHYGLQLTLVIIATIVLFLPFYLTFRSLVGGFPLGLVTWAKTPLHSFLIIFGLFLAPLVLYLLLATPADLRGFWLRWLPWVMLAALGLGLLVGFPLLLLLPLALYALLLAIARADQPAHALALWALALGCLICLGTEFLYIRDGFNSRMNTIFKFYYQVWLIWGVLASYALWYLYTQIFSRRRVPGLLFSGLLIALLAGALVYPWQTAGRRFREGERIGLAGRTPRQHTPASAAAIEWLRTNAPDDAVVLEAVGGAYDPQGLGFGGVSASSGLATVLGWPGHEYQWRGGDPALLEQIGPRTADVTTIYSSTGDLEPARQLLAKYKVGYIFVGDAERASYPEAGLAKLSQLGTPVFERDEVTIYQVK